METQGGYVGLVNLYTYYQFLQDEPGVLAERIFESNVRGYQQDTSVNKEIRASLENNTLPSDFWILNNGITMLASETGSAGYLGLNVSDPQIVNGLQTSREIFNYFHAASLDSVNRQDDARSVLVRVIIITDPAAKDLVIKSTNSQNQMLPASLRGADQSHRDIEELFKALWSILRPSKGILQRSGPAHQKNRNSKCACSSSDLNCLAEA
jgi:AIPR protein